MKPVSKVRHRGLRLLSRSCSPPTLTLASFFCFFLGLLRGQFQAQPSATPNPGTEVSLKQVSGAEFERRELPVYQPYAHGETGEEKVENFAFQLLSWSPRAYIYPRFADNETCDKIVALARTGLAPSTLALKPGDREEDQKGVRTSSGAYFSGSEDPSGALAWVERKMARLTAVPVNFGEPFNILRYSPGQKYEAHMDTFDPKEFGPQSTNRIASFLLYLSDVEEGGETVFPNEGGVHRTESFDECVGLKVKPRKGDALLFWSMTPQRSIDRNALHAGCPVIKGEKWVATKWLRDSLNS